MKRFLISFIIGFTLMAAGVTTLIFELQDFRFVEELPSEVLQDLKMERTIVHQKDLHVELEDALSYHMVIDNTLKDGEVQLQYPEYVRSEMVGNTMRFYVQGVHRYSISDTLKSLRVLIDGMKKREIYTVDSYYGVHITCNEQTGVSITGD